MRTNTKKWIAGASAVGALIAAGGGIAVGTGAVGDDDETEAPITGDALERATEVVLAEHPDARVTDTEVDDEDGKYEVEITLSDGGQMDVHLDAQFEIIGDEAEGPEDD